MADRAVMMLPVDEYKNLGLRVSVVEWDSLTQCAVHHRVNQRVIKNLIHFGGTLDGLTTFDIPTSCSMNTRVKAGKGNRKIIEVYDETTGAKLGESLSGAKSMSKTRGAIA